VISPLSSPVEGCFKNTGLGYNAFYCGSNPFLLIFVLIYMNATVDSPSMLAGLPTIYIGAFCSVQMSDDWTHQAHATMPAVAERLRQAYPAPFGRAGVGSIPANPRRVKGVFFTPLAI